MAEAAALEQRILVLAPTGRDAALAAEVLGRAGLSAEAVRDAQTLCVALESGVGAVLVAEEALTPEALKSLSGVLARQPPWSDVLVVIFAATVDDRAATARMQLMMDVLGNVTFVERPVRAATLVTVMKAALRARSRQYTAREILSAFRQQEEETRKRADFEQQLIGIVSHDLRNPLSAIQLCASSLLRNEEALSEWQLKPLLRIQSAAERASSMVKDLLDFTQARLGGGIRIDPRPTDLHEVTRAVLEEVEATHPGREVQLRHEGEGLGEWDKDRLGQVVQNLATNAIRYSPDGTPVRVVTRGEGDWTCLSIHNRGAPIPAQKLSTLFEPLRRATNEIDRDIRSVGLGLYIVKEIVDAHGGTIEVESNEAEGTTFTVRLPRGPSAAARR